MANKTTKRTLLSSVMALILCFAMLLGTTYAWFTDTVTSAGNKIVAGTLDVEMYWADGAKEVPTTDAGWTDVSTGAIFGDEYIWEPGLAVARHIKIANKGTLALKYSVKIVANGEVSELSDVIDVYYADPAVQVDAALTGANRLGTLTEVLTALGTTGMGNLAAKTDDTVTLVLKMQESATNKYQGLSIGTDFSVVVIATQDTVENDSFDNQYDKFATIDTEAELIEALAADYDLIQIGANIAITNTIEIPAGKTVTIDLAGCTLSQTRNDLSAAYAVISNEGNLTINDSVGSGKISFADTTPYTADNGFASNTIKNMGTLTINGGTIENLTPAEVMNFAYPHAIDVYQGSVTTINGGTVKSLNYDCIRMFCNSETLATKVVINGGTIVNRVSFQDPQSTRPGYGILEINGGNFVTMNGVNANVRLLNFCQNCSNMKATVTGGTFDKGFKTQDMANSGIQTSDWLIMGTGVTVTTAAELQAAIDAATDGTVIKLAADITGDVTVTQKENTKITIDGNKTTYHGSINIDGKSATILTAGLTIKNVNFDATAITSDACINMGIESNTNNTRYVTNLTVEGCTFTGNYPTAEQVGIKTYTGGGANLKVVDCVATNMHSLAQIHNIVNVEFSGCEVVGCKNGISVGSSRNAKITDCDITAVAYGIRCDGGETDSALTITDCDITAHIPVVVRKVSKGYNLTVNGNNTMTETNDEGLWCVAATNEYGDVDKAGLTVIGANVTINVNDSTLDTNGVFVKQ